MATFSAYPALQVRAPDIPGAIQRGREDVQTNWLRQTKIQSGIAEQGRLNQLRQIMPGVGAEAGLGPQAQKALALDPDKLATLMKIPQGERDRAKERLKVLSNFGMAILNSPGIQRPALDAQLRRVWAGYGAAPEVIPPLGDPGYEAFLISNIAEAGDVVAMLDQAEQATPPSGYRNVEGGLERIPGGPADPAVAGRLAAAKRGPDGGATPAQQANNAEIDAARMALNRMNLDRAEILRRTQKSTNTGRENPDYDPSLERLVRTATQRKVGNDPKFNLYHRRYLGPAPEFSDPAGPKALPPGVSAEQPGILDRLSEFFSGDGDTPAPASDDGRLRGRRRGGGRVRGRSGSTKKPIRQMSAAEIVNLLDGRGEELTEDERKAIQARLDALGL